MRSERFERKNIGSRIACVATDLPLRLVWFGLSFDHAFPVAFAKLFTCTYCLVYLCNV
jgi:hypothetical protein